MLVKLSDDELSAVMSAARPLAVDLRDEFLQAVASELAAHDQVGPGTVFLVCREQQSRFSRRRQGSRQTGRRRASTGASFSTTPVTARQFLPRSLPVYAYRGRPATPRRGARAS